MAFQFFYLIQRLFLHYPGNAEQAECVKMNKKTLKTYLTLSSTT